MLLDSLSVIMAILASSLCFLIFVYSTEYMANEGDRNRFFFLMLAFGGGMLTLVLSNNLLIGFIGWEIMGFCSYGLIGFWNDRRNPPEVDPTGYDQTNPLLQFETEGAYNSYAGTKAFIVTRIGDALMLGGILLLFMFTGSFLFSDMAASGDWWIALAGAGLLIPTFLLIFAGAIGKSGQFPLQVWLPEAMAGPTSVSALIHAATMVKAGVYITARFLVTMVGAAEVASGGPPPPHPFVALQSFGLEIAANFFLIVAVIGAITALLTATMGMVSNELKQILAFSTLSQLGYMMTAIGTGGLLLSHYEGAYLASVLHVVAHGAFKALLFLAAGGVIHGVHTKYISKMGGLKKHMKKTWAVMWVGVFALSGIPPFSGFWSKDSIIEYTYELALHDQAGMFLFIFTVLAAACTIFYSFRMMGITFYGESTDEDDHSQEEHSEEDDHQEEHSEEDHHQVPHDPGPAMMVPLYILAAFTIFAFLIFPFIQAVVLEEGPMTLGLWWSTLVHMVEVKFSPEGIVPFSITILALLAGGLSGWWIYIKNDDKPNTIIGEEGFRRRVYNLFKHRWYINEGYHWFLRKFLRFAEMWKYRVDDKIIDGIDFKSADAAIAISTKVRWVDDNIVDGFAEGISTRSVSASESGLSGTQTGKVNDYVSVVIFGIGIMIILALISLGVI
jgi:NADH-quinone oxidoreductase subunit L